MSTSPSHYVRSRGKILGPFSVEQLQLLRDRGQLRGFHEVSADRQTWVKASSLTELFPPEALPFAVAAPSVYRDEDAPSVARSSSQTGEYPFNASVTDTVRDGWRRVRTGLGLVLLSNYIALGGYAIFVVGMLLMWAAGAVAFSQSRCIRDEIGVDESLGVGIMFLLVLWLLTQAAATILQLVGHGFCMGVAPRRDSGVKGLAITVFVLAATALVLSMLTRMAGFVAIPQKSSDWFVTVLLLGGPFRLPVYLLDAATFCLLLFFLRSVATALGMKNLAQNVVVLLFSSGGFLVAAMVLIFILILALTKRHARFDNIQFHLIGPFAFFILAVLGCIGLILYVWFLVVLHQTRSALSRHLSGS